MDLRFYYLVFLRRLPWFLLMLVIGTVAGVVIAKVLPTTYVSTARLVVESEQIPDNLAASTVQTQASEQLQIIQQRLLSRDNLIDMANRLQVYAGDRRMSADDIVQDMRSRISMAVTGGVAVRNRPTQATLVNVGFRAGTSQMAASVANDLVTSILREDVSMRTTTARQTLDFFQQEVSRLDQGLARISAQILAFKEENQGALPDSLDFRRSQLVTAQTRLQEFDRLEAQLRDRRAQTELMKNTAGQNGGLPTGGIQSPEQQRLQALREQLAQVRAILAPGNPRVTLLEAQVAAQEKIVSDQLAAASGVITSDGGTVSLFDTQIADIDKQIADIETQRAQVGTSISQLQGSIDATPANGVRLETMQRDYDNTQAQYNDAVAKRARAETGEVIEALSKGQRISIIEQAVPPTQPASPNRPLIVAGGIGIGTLLGLALVVLAELLRPGLRRPSEVTAKLGITPLMSLPYILTPAEVARQRTIVVSSLVAAGCAVALLLWLIHSQYMPLDVLLGRIAGRLQLSGLPTLHHLG